MSLTAHGILRHSPFFGGVSPAELERLVALARVVRLDRHQLAFSQGDDCPGLYVIGLGRVRVFKVAPGGKEHVLHIMERGQTFAEVAAIGGFPCPASAEALEDTICALIPSAPLRAALAGSHDLCLQLMGSLCGWVRHLVGLMEDLFRRDASGRVARYLLDAAGPDGRTVHLPGLKRHLASHLNLTSETLSRTLRRFADAGLLADTPERGLTLTHREGLAAIAGGAGPLV